MVSELVCDGLSRARVEGRKAHKNYRTADPFAVAEQLRSAGWDTSIHYGGRTRQYLGSPSTAIVEATGRPLDGSHGYQRHAIGYFDHRGRSSVLIQGGALRCCCRNAFVAPAYRLHHCSEDLQAFLDDPVKYFGAAADLGERTAHYVERFRGVPGGLNLPMFLRSRARNLGASALRYFTEYSREDGPSVWAGLQSLTNVHSRRVNDFVGRCLATEGGRHAMLEGDVPAYLWS
jgi:hypothetical protein